MMKIKFTRDYPETAEDFFQAEVKCTKDQVETIIGFKLSDRTKETETEEWRFKGCALLDETRPVPFIVHNWLPNHRDNPPEYVWHIRTTFYHDGLILKNFFDSILHPKEQ